MALHHFCYSFRSWLSFMRRCPHDERPYCWAGYCWNRRHRHLYRYFLFLRSLTAGVLSIIASNTSDQERPTYIGLVGAMWGLASVLGPVLGGAFTASAGGWRWVFDLPANH